MGFYQSKLKTYSKYITFNPQLMAVTQDKIIKTREENLGKIKDDYKVAQRFHLESLNEDVVFDINLLEKEIKFMKTLDTVDFYQYLINVENYNLVEILQESAKKRNEYASNIDKYSNKKGLFGQNKTVGGITNRKIEKNTTLLNKEDLTLGVTAESMSEWKGLSPDDHVIYLVGRFELEGKDGFDLSSFEQYRDTVYKLNHINEKVVTTETNEKQ